MFVLILHSTKTGPTFRHPMRALLHLVGKALYFVANQMPGEHFIIPSTRDVPAFLRSTTEKFGGKEIEARVLDIEGCYPNMPKELIRFAMREIIEEARRHGKSGVSVPTRSKTRKCTWRRTNGGPWKFIDFERVVRTGFFARSSNLPSEEWEELTQEDYGRRYFSSNGALASKPCYWPGYSVTASNTGRVRL